MGKGIRNRSNISIPKKMFIGDIMEKVVQDDL